MSCFKIINLEITSNRLSNPFPYIHRIWCLILLKYDHLLPFLKTCLGKRKTQSTAMSYSFLLSAYLLSTLVTFLSEVFGERGICFRPTYQCSIYVVLWPLPTTTRIIWSPYSFPYWSVHRLLGSSANWLFQGDRGEGKQVEETIISLLLYKQWNFTGFFFKEEKF